LAVLEEAGQVAILVERNEEVGVRSHVAKRVRECETKRRARAADRAALDGLGEVGRARECVCGNLPRQEVRDVDARERAATIAVRACRAVDARGAGATGESEAEANARAIGQTEDVEIEPVARRAELRAPTAEARGVGRVAQCEPHTRRAEVTTDIEPHARRARGRDTVDGSRWQGRSCDLG